MLNIYEEWTNGYDVFHHKNWLHDGRFLNENEHEDGYWSNVVSYNEFHGKELLEKIVDPQLVKKFPAC